MRALRTKKNPGAAWHETEAMAAAEQAARVTPGSRAASFYIGKRAAHTESAIESGARGMNPPPGSPAPQGWMLEKGTRKKAKVWMRWIVDAHGQGIGKMVVQREAQAWRAFVGYRYGKQWSYESIGEYPSATRAMHAASASLSEQNPRRPHGTFRSCVRQVKQSLKHYKRRGDPKKICGAAVNPTGRWYWGKLRSMKGSAAAFYSERKPTQDSHGKVFTSVTGPFQSRQGAEDNIRYFGWKLERESMNPCRTKKNPIAIYNKPRVIYGKCLALYAQKTSGQYAGQRFKHTFKNPVVVIGNPDGSVLLKSTVGKKLWGA